MSCTKPNFFILGAPKCGTSSMVEWLNEHPQIYMSAVKEPNYFNSDHNLTSVRSQKEYFSLFDGATTSHKVMGEASVWYLYSTEAVANIEQSLTAPKYLIMLRDPVDMAISLFQQQQFAGFETITNFKEAWEVIPERKKGRQIPRLCREPSHLYYNEACRLGEQLERVYHHVDQQRVKVVFLDDIKEDSRECYNHVLEFLDVDPLNKKEFAVSNEAKVPKSRLILTIIRSLGWLTQKLNLPRFHYGFIDQINDLISKPEKKEITDRDYDQYLRQYFKSDIEKIEQLTNRDLSHWKNI